MRKRLKGNRLLASILISVLIIASIFIVYFSVKSSNKTPFLSVSDLSTNVGQCSGGWTTLSISDVNIQPVGDRIRVSGVAKGSECLRITLRQSDLDSKLNSQGLDATKDIIGSV